MELNMAGVVSITRETAEFLREIAPHLSPTQRSTAYRHIGQLKSIDDMDRLGAERGPWECHDCLHHNNAAARACSNCGRRREPDG